MHPQLPGADFPVLCFYPMSKARGEGRNWYALAFNERKRLMGVARRRRTPLRRTASASSSPARPASTTGSGA